MFSLCLFSILRVAWEPWEPKRSRLEVQLTRYYDDGPPRSGNLRLPPPLRFFKLHHNVDMVWNSLSYI